MPHLFWAHDLGTFDAYFQGAWDESFYALAMADIGIAWNDYPLRVFGEALLAWTAGPSAAFAISSDMLWPGLSAAAAFLLSSAVVRSANAAICAAIAFLFAGDVLSFNSSVVHSVNWILSYEMREWPPGLRPFVLDAYNTFLQIYRTPEPQLSFAVFFLQLAALARVVLRPFPAGRDWLVLAAACALNWSAYAFFALGGYMMVVAAALAMAVCRNWRQALWLAAIGGGSVVLLAARLWISHEGEAGATLYSSSLPLVSPSVIYGLVLAVVSVAASRRRLLNDPVLLFGVFALLAPLVTLNQQVLTGIMVQALNWERYINFPCLVLGALLVARQLDLRSWLVSVGRRSALLIERGRQALLRDWPRLRLRMDRGVEITGGLVGRYGHSMLLALVVVTTVAFIYSAQLTTYRQFASFNAQTLALARLADRVRGSRSEEHDILLAAPALDAAVRARSDAPAASFRGYSDIVASLDASGTETSRPDIAEWGYAYAWHLGLEPAALGSALNSEIDAGVCWPHLMYYVPFLECAPYVSDFRLYDTGALKARVPAIVDGYVAFLGRRPDRLVSAILLHTGTPEDAAEVNPFWQEDVIASEQVRLAADGYGGPIAGEAYAVRQVPRTMATTPPTVP